MGFCFLCGGIGAGSSGELIAFVRDFCKGPTLTV